ncbi:hypothetical protein [Actinomadura luteofluorescens]
MVSGALAQQENRSPLAGESAYQQRPAAEYDADVANGTVNAALWAVS